MMKICMVSNSYYPYVGGIAEHIFNLSQRLRARGHIVKVLTTNFNDRMCLADREPRTANRDEEFTHRIGTGLLIRANKSFARLPIGWRLSDKVEKFFKKEKFDIVHIHGSLAPTLPILAIRHSTSVNIITFHASHPNNSNLAMWLCCCVAPPILKPYMHKLHGRIAVSETARDSNMHYFPGSCKVIPNAVNVDVFNPSVQPKSFLDACPGDRTGVRPKVLFLGRFEPRKGLKYLLQAMPIVKQHIPDVLLVVCGAGVLGYAYHEYISKDVKDNIHFTGLIVGEERPHYYASCNVFCAPSIGHESFGIVLLEAMASGKPVVASDISGYRTIIENGKQGFLAKPRSPEDIAGCLVKVLSNPALAKTMGETGRKKSLTYSWDHISLQIEDYYDELLQNGYGPPKADNGDKQGEFN